MYCSSCGVAIAPGLSYCNYCGARLNGATDNDSVDAPAVKPELLVSAMVASFVLGLVAIMMLMGMMKAVLNLDAGVILAFALLSFLVMLFLEGVFVRLLFRGRRGAKKADEAGQLTGPQTKELDAAPPRVLRESMPSVTEHTTRTFEPIYNEPRSK